MSTVETGTVHRLGEAPPPESLTEVLNAARAALEQEFQTAQVLDLKARGLATLGAQWFGIAQAVAAVAYATKKPDTVMLVLVAIAASAGAGALGKLFFNCWNVWKLRNTVVVTPKGLLQMREAVFSEASATKLVDHYAARLKDRRETNRSRADALGRAEIWWFVAMGVPAIELGLALATRLFS